MIYMSGNQEVKGNTLKVYLYLIKNGPSELRNIQRGVHLSSASLASYHLGKLVEAGFVKQDEHGNYYTVKESSDKVLEGYSKVGPKVVPQMFFFALFFTIIVAFFVMAACFWPSFILFLGVVCIAMVIVFWYETIKLWHKLSV